LSEQTASPICETRLYRILQNQELGNPGRLLGCLRRADEIEGRTDKVKGLVVRTEFLRKA
jgi:hypothetical protein